MLTEEFRNKMIFQDLNLKSKLKEIFAKTHKLFGKDDDKKSEKDSDSRKSASNKHGAETESMKSGGTFS